MSVGWGALSRFADVWQYCETVHEGPSQSNAVGGVHHVDFPSGDVGQAKPDRFRAVYLRLLSELFNRTPVFQLAL